MKQFTFRTLYPVVIVIVLVGVLLGQSLRQRQTAQAEASALRNSLYWEPWEFVPGASVSVSWTWPIREFHLP